jgi:hypothetical protein
MVHYLVRLHDYPAQKHPIHQSVMACPMGNALALHVINLSQKRRICTFKGISGEFHE